MVLASKRPDLNEQSVSFWTIRWVGFQEILRRESRRSFQILNIDK